MKVVDVEKLKEILDSGEIVIDEDVDKCESMHDVLVYLLNKIEDFLNEKIDSLPTIEMVHCKDCMFYDLPNCMCRNMQSNGNSPTYGYCHRGKGHD